MLSFTRILPPALLLLACGGSPPPSPASSASSPPASTASTPPSATPNPPPSTGPSTAETPPPTDPHKLHFIAYGKDTWAMRFLNQKLHRRAQNNSFERYQGQGKWLRDDFLSTFPTSNSWQGTVILEAEGNWPSHLYAPVHGKFDQIFEYKDQQWKPTTLRYAEQLQPWADGSVIGLVPGNTPNPFVVYGNPKVPLPKPARLKKQRFFCPHRLVVHGYKAKTTGDLALWGTECKQGENYPDNYHIERFYPDGRRETIEFPQPTKRVWGMAWNGRPPVLAVSPDDIWIPTLQLEPQKAWLMAHYDGKSIQYEALPFGGQEDFFGADLKASDDGTLWFTFRAGHSKPLELWSRSKDGQWTQWEVPSISAMPGEERSYYNYANLFPVGNELWMEADYYTSGSVMGHAILCTKDYSKVKP